MCTHGLEIRSAKNRFWHKITAENISAWIPKGPFVSVAIIYCHEWFRYCLEDVNILNNLWIDYSKNI